MCQVSACAQTAGQEIAVVVPFPRQPVNQPTVYFAAGGADVCVASVCAMTSITLEISARGARRAKTPANHTGTGQLLFATTEHDGSTWRVFVLSVDINAVCHSLFQEVCALPSGSWSDPKRGRTLQQHLYPIGGLHG